jgi:hypothetical protein
MEHGIGFSKVAHLPASPNRRDHWLTSVVDSLLDLYRLLYELCTTRRLYYYSLLLGAM